MAPDPDEFCPWCEHSRATGDSRFHAECRPDLFFCACACGLGLLDRDPISLRPLNQGDPMTEPEQPEPTDNTERPEDGDQDVDQSPSLDYSQPGDVDLQDPT